MMSGNIGTGQGPGRNPGRVTGTIPKVKGHNEGSLPLHQNHPHSRNTMSTRSPFTSCGSAYPQQKQLVMNAPKNQVPLSWSSENSSPRPLRKNGPNNTIDQCRSMSDGWDSWSAVGSNNSLGAINLRSLLQIVPDSETNGCGESNSLPTRHRPRMNGQDVAPTSSSLCSSQTNRETCRNEIHLEPPQRCEPKKTNNIPRMNCAMESARPRGVSGSVSGGVSGGVPSPSFPVQPSALLMPNAPLLNGQGDSVSKSSEFKNRNELKMKLEEEERKLHALQEKQSMLLRRRKQMMNYPLDEGCQNDGSQRERSVDGRPSDSYKLRLESELRALQENCHGVGDGPEAEGASSEDSAVEDSYEEYMEAQHNAHIQGQIVRDKLAEINCLRAQLKQVKGLINMAQRSPGSVRSETAASTGVARAESIGSDQAVNKRSGQLNSSHDDGFWQQANVSRRPDSKAEELENEKARLRHLQALVARVQEFHSANLPIPEHLLAELKSETENGKDSSPGHLVPAAAQETENVEETGQRLPTGSGVGGGTGEPTFQRFMENDVDDVDNDENALDDLSQTMGQPEPNDMMTSRQYHMPIQPGSCSNVMSKRPKRVNMACDEDGLVDIGSRANPEHREAVLKEMMKKISFSAPMPWDNLTASTPPSQDDGSLVVNDDSNGDASEMHQEGQRASDCGCQHQRTSRKAALESPHPNFQNEQSLHHRSNVESSPYDIPDEDLGRIWSAVPETEDDEASMGRTVDAQCRRQSVQQDDTCFATPTFNIFNQAQEVQNRLRALTQSYQGLLADGNMEVLPGGRPDRIFSTMMSNLPPQLTIPPPSFFGTNSCDREHYYQQLFAASQLQYQQVLVTAVNQCYHLLWLQHQELASLRSTVHMLTSNPGIAQGQQPWGISPPSPAPVPPTLNNQVPPGNRTNNYWDNFRSYSRQNLLSAGQAKSNEVFLQQHPNPSPLAERSHNTLHHHHPTNPTSISLGAAAAAAAAPAPAPAVHLLSGHPVPPPASSSATCGPPTPAATQPDDFAIYAPLSALPFEPANISRKDKRKTAYQEHENQQSQQRQRVEGSLADAAGVHPGALPHENSSLDAQVPTPMPFLRPHPSLTPRLSNQASELQEAANRSAASERNHVNVDGFHGSENHRWNANDGCGRSPRQSGSGSSWISRQNWNNTCWPLNCQMDTTVHSAHTMPDFRFNNVSVLENNAVTKRNSSAHKRTHSLLTQHNYQRNNHVGTAPNSQASGSRNIPAASHQQNSLSLSEPSETNLKSAKNQPVFDGTRNILYSQRESAPNHRSASSRMSEQPESWTEQDDSSRALLLQHGMDELACEQNKNQLKENRLHMNKSPKYPSKTACANQPGDFVPESQSGDQHAAYEAFREGASQSVNRNPRGIRPPSKARPSCGDPRLRTNRNQGPAKTSALTPPSNAEDVREAVFAEVASLISANENPQCLLQLLRNLQVASSDSRKQNAANAAPTQRPTDLQQANTNEELKSGAAAGESIPEDERPAAKESHVRRGRQRNAADGRPANSYDRAGSLPECEARETPPGDSGDKFKELAVELSSYIRAHAHDTCTSSMIDEICELVLLFVPFNRPVGRATAANASQFFHVLENALHRFQGRRLEAVCDDLTAVILKVLTNELSFVHLIDALDQNAHESEAESNVSICETSGLGRSGSICDSSVPGQPAPPPPPPAPPGEVAAPPPPPLPMAQQEVDAELMEIGLVSELASNGDLAEADQSLGSSLANGELAANLCSEQRRTDAEAEDEDLEGAVGLEADAEDSVAYFPSTANQANQVGACGAAKVDEECSLEECSLEECSLDARPANDLPMTLQMTLPSKTCGSGCGGGEQSAAVQDWEEDEVESQMAALCVDHGLDHDRDHSLDHGLDQVPSRLAGDNPSHVQMCANSGTV